MALMKENSNWFSRKVIEKQRENISFHMQMGFRNWCTQSAKTHWVQLRLTVCRHLAELGLPAASPSGKLSDSNSTAARLHVATGNHVMSSHGKKSAQTCQLSSVKSKAHSSLSSSRPYTSRAPKLLPVARPLH